MRLKQTFEIKQALGSDVTIVLIVDEARSVDALMADIWRAVYSFERRFSRFLPASELCQFNRQAGVSQAVSAEFYALLVAAQRMARLSSGLFNPFILPALQRAGYLQSAQAGYETDQVDDYRHKAVTTADNLLLKDGVASIPYGTAIDMGGCGKGYLADMLADMLDKADLAGYWISLGGDMVLNGTDESGKPWNVSVQSADPKHEDAPVFIHTRGGRFAVATSGTFRRANQPGGSGSWHHLINPQTLKPATTNIRLATVVASDCITADVLASCAAIVERHAAADYLRARQASGWVIQAETAEGLAVDASGKMVQAIRGQEYHAQV